MPRRAEQQPPERVRNRDVETKLKVSESWSEKEIKQRKKKRKRKCVRETERQNEKRRGPEGVSERRASRNVASDIPYGRRQASANEQSYKLITYQTERGE